ncbi:MAG TPA: glycoside hydrolase family 3 N-terminal domain-containing protein [Elusimicrobiota bacterium]|nr:glycoside hydrolase family 3 N-terminal domain-containing protein [Elusimicrobiota bacterium]
MRTLALAAALALAALPARAAKVPDPRDLSVEELVGQTFMIAIDTEIAVAREADVRAGRLGGGMLRWDKFTGAQALEMTGKLRAWSKESPHRIPFWVSTDHEGGPTFTQRLYGLAPFPGSMALGAAGSPDLTREAAEATARELRALGIDVTFAPSLDVNNNPANPIIGLRSYGEDPALVTKLGLAALRGYRDGGILAVPKHFPGHGDTSEDSHLGLPVNTKPLAELEKTELPPFRAAIQGGAQAIMPAHMVFPALGAPAGRPNTLSREVLGGFLRGTLGFKGLIFSDSLDMGAIVDVYGSSESAVLALLAGNDVLLIGKGDYPSAFSAAVEAVKSGRIPRARVEASVARILEAKRRLGLFSFSEPKPLKAKTVAADRALAQKAADDAVTLVWNQGLVPLHPAPPQRLSLVVFHTGRYGEEASRWAADVAKRHPNTEVFDLPVSPSSAAVAGVLARTRTAAAVIVGTFQYGYAVPAPQAELIRGLVAGPAPVAAVSLMNPYDLALSSGARAGIAAYGMTDSALEAATRLLFGEIPPRGRLPVTVPGLPPAAR